MSRIRQREMHARRIRKVKLKKLRGMYKSAKTVVSKEKIAEKVGRVSPCLTKEAFEKSC